MKKFILAFVLIILIVGISVWFFYYRGQNVPKKYTGEIQQVNLKLKWLNQSQFAGNYVAIEKGFYSDWGLKVNLIPYTFDSSPIDDVIAGKAEFGLTSAGELLMAREKGIPIKAIAVIYKTNPAVMYSLKKNGIIKPTDFKDKIIGLEKGSDTIYLYRAMLKNINLDSNLVKKEVEIGFDGKEILDGSVDVSTGYIMNEPNLIKEAGQEVNTILMADYGVNVYSDIVFTTENLIKTNPDLVGRFLSATLDGWQYAIENSNEAIDMTLKYATNTTRIHQENMLNESIPLINTGLSDLGWMKLTEWEQTYKILLDQGILTKQINVKDAFDMQFLSNYYLNKTK